MNVDPLAHFIIHADDISVFFVADNCQDLVKQANSTMALLGAWAKQNYLKRNATKTEAVLFLSKKRPVKLNSDNIINSSASA